MKNEIARPKVILDGKQAEQELDNLTAKAKKYRDAMMEAAAAGDSQAEKRMQQQLKATNTEIRNLKKEAFDVDRVLKNINGASFNELSQAVRKATNDLKKMQQTDPGYTEQQKKVTLLKTKLADLSNEQKANTPLWGRMADGANKYFNMITLGIATLTGIVFSLGQFIKGMVGLDDALADVMKTTNLTRREVREMYQDFKYLNTRTPRAELLALAEEAGRLGKVGKKDIMDFVEVANKIKISLGDDLGGNAEQAIREVGKLTEIFRVGNQYGTDFKTLMEKMGSGLNQVANNSNASAEFLIEYMKRLGGISTQAKITAADIMGYASTFDQLGQNVEMAATAQSKVVVDMFTDPGKYAKIAKMEVSDFSKLLKKDANEAFIKFLDGLNGNNEGLSEMATKLDGLGIDGARAIQALAVLSANTKMLREQQILANDAMEKGTSLNTEYAIKNNNMAGSLEKLGAFIRSKFISSGFIGYLEKVIGKTAEWVEQPVEAKLRSEQRELNVLIAAISNANTTQENRNDLIAELQKTYPDFLGNLNAEKVTNEELRTRLEDVNKQYEDRILLMIKEDMLTKNYRERTELKIKELELIKQIGAAETIAAEARKKITSGMDPNSYRNVLTQKEFDAMRDLPILTAALQDNREQVSELKQAETELNAALGELRVNRTTSPAGGTPPPPPTGGKTPLTPEEIKAAKEAKEKAYKSLETSNRKELNLVKQHQLDINATEEEYNKALEEEEMNALNKKLGLQIEFGDDYSETKAAILDKELKKQQDLNKKTAEEKKKSYKKELDDLENKGKNELAQVEKYALSKGLSEEETNALLIAKEIEFLNYKLDLQKSYGEDTVETAAAIAAKINELAKNALKGDEERLKSLANLKKEYDKNEVNAKKERDDALIELEKARNAGLIESEKEYQRLKKGINDKYEEAKLKQSIEFGQKVQQIVSLGSNLVQALMDAELAKAGDNEEKKAQIQKKYANARFLMATSEIVVNTAVAIMEGFAQLGPIGGAIAAVILGATGAVQLGIANKERQKMMGSKQSGGFSNTDGSDSEPDGIYHKNEFIGSGPSVRNPTIKPIYDIINLAQQNGTIATLNLPAVLAATGKLPTGRQSGGYSSGSTSASSSYPQFVSESDKEMKQILSENLRAIRELMNWKPKVTSELIKKDLKTLDDIESNRGL